MVNTIGEGDRHLVTLNYRGLLEAILNRLQHSETRNPFRFSSNGQQLLIEIDDIAYHLATTKASEIDNPLSGNYRSGRVATTHFKDSARDHFVNYNRKIRDCLEKQLKSILKPEGDDPLKSYVSNLLKNHLTQFNRENHNQISFNYNFDKKYPQLSKQRLTLKHDDTDIPALKFHRLTITIKQGSFDTELKDSLKNYIEHQFNEQSQDEIEEIIDDLYKERDQVDTDWYHLKRLMDTEAIAKVQRTAKIKYLEYIAEQISSSHTTHLDVLICRLKALEKYFDDPNKSDGDYQVSYASEKCNLKEIFSRSEIFDALPIIPIIEGNLGEIRDSEKNELKFIFGLKLKLGGKVQTEGGQKSLEYHLNLLNPESDSHKQGLANPAKKEAFVRKILKIAVLYFFVFAGNDPSATGYSLDSDLEYDIVSIFEKTSLSVFKVAHEKVKEKLFKAIAEKIKHYGTENKIDNLKNLLTARLKKNKLWNSRNYPIHINVKKGILVNEANVITENSTIFTEELRQNDKKALKYISISDASIDTTSLCYFEGNLQIDEIGYFETPDMQEFSLEYSAKRFPTLPVVVFPKEDKCKKILDKNFQNQDLIIFPYAYERLKQNIFQEDKLREEFIYRFTFSLLAYISLKLLLDTATEKCEARFFIPILRLHLGDKQNPHEEEVFMRSLFKLLSHLFNENHLSNSQGLRISNAKLYRIKNGLSSLYSVLPKKFQLSHPVTHPKISKLAIIVVSSRECDRSWQGNYKKSNLMGEIVKIDRQNDNSILIYRRKTISQHYDSGKIHRDPDILIREVEQLYQQGYRHILYIAKSPYSQTLNLTNTENDNLYFMSPQIIHNLKNQREDLKIYPIFFDQYYVVSLQTSSRKSLYIQDTDELTNLVNDPHQRNAIFFNLFNGIKIRKDENYYNGVISYSTLLGVYEQNLLDTKDIYLGLIDTDHNQGLKHEILQLLTLFHFSRYEAGSNNIQLKLDPYQNIIGSDSVGALSMFPHIEANLKFNCLAFLNEVKDALDAKLDSE